MIYLASAYIERAKEQAVLGTDKMSRHFVCCERVLTEPR